MKCDTAEAGWRRDNSLFINKILYNKEIDFMKSLIKKVRENKKGFTLAELLVVVAIVGILVAISIPVFTAQLSKARKATNQANLRAAKAAAIADYLTEKSDATDDVTYNYDMTTGGVKVVGENNVTQVASAEVTIDSAASNVKYTKNFMLKLIRKLSGLMQLRH